MKLTDTIIYCCFTFVVGFICATSTVLFFIGPAKTSPEKYELAYLGIIGVLIALSGVVISYKVYVFKRQSRKWEMNKGIIVELLPLLHKSIKASEDCITNCFEEMDVIEQSQYYGNNISYSPINVDWSYEKDLNRILDQLRTTHRPFLSADFVTSIDVYFSNLHRIRNANFEGNVDDIESHEESISNSKRLINEVYKLCRLSGIKAE